MRGSHSPQAHCCCGGQTVGPAGAQKGIPLTFANHGEQCSGFVTLWYLYESGSIPLTNGSGCASGSEFGLRILLFSSAKFKMPQPKIFFFPSFFAYSYLKVHLHNSAKMLKSHKKSHKTVEIKVFLNFFCLLMEGSGWASHLEGHRRK